MYKARRRGGTDLVAFDECTGTTSTENIDVDYRERCRRVGHSSGGFEKASESGKRVAGRPTTAPLTHDGHTILLDNYHHYPHQR